MKFFKFLLATALMFGIANAKDVLVLGTNAEYPPFEFVDENTTITGFDMELVAELAKRAEVKYEILNMSFDGLIPALKSGKIDFIASAMSATDERRNAVDFTDAYYSTENLYVKRKADTTINSKDDLKGKKVAAQLGTVQEAAVRDQGLDVTTNENMTILFMSLKNSKVDAICVDSSVGYEYLKQNDDLAEFFTEPDGSEGFSFAFDKGKYPEVIAKFNAALEEVKKDGTYDKLLEKYNLK